MPTTAFTPLAEGGASFNPLMSYTYRPIGVIISAPIAFGWDPVVLVESRVQRHCLQEERHEPDWQASPQAAECGSECQSGTPLKCSDPPPFPQRYYLGRSSSWMQQELRVPGKRR